MDAATSKLVKASRAALKMLEAHLRMTIDSNSVVEGGVRKLDELARVDVKHQERVIGDLKTSIAGMEERRSR